MKKGNLLILSILISSSIQFVFGQNTVQEYITVGSENISKLDYTKAQEMFEKALKLDPRNETVNFNLGEINLYFNKKEEASIYFQKTFEQNGELMGESGLKLSQLYFEKGFTSDAFSVLNLIINKDTSNHLALYHRAKLKYTRKDYMGARQDFEKAKRLDPSNPHYYYFSGLNSVEVYQWNEAIIDFTQCITHQAPKDELENAYFYRAYCYYQEGMDPKYKGHHGLFVKALNDYNSCMKLIDDDAEAYFNRGECNMQLGHYVAAISDFKHAILLDPKNYDAYYNKAICNYHFGEVRSAIKDLNNVIALNPDYLDAYYQLGVMQYELGAHKQAMENFDSLIHKQKDHGDAFLFRGYTNLEMNNKLRACQDFDSAAKLDEEEAVKNLEKYCAKVDFKTKKVE